MNLDGNQPELDEVIRTHPDISEKLLYFEDLLWMCQQQPCYLANLSGSYLREPTLPGVDSMSLPARLEVYFRVVSNIYRELSDPRIKHLLLALTRMMAANEINLDKGLEDLLKTLFDPNTSPVARMLAMLMEHTSVARKVHTMIYDGAKSGSL